MRTGRGEYVDFARYDAVLQALDPPFGAQGQAAAARGLSTARRGRPKNQDSYPIFASRDGWVRICILAPRQWRAMRAWLGEPAEFQDVKYDSISARAADFDKIRTLIARLFARHSGEQLVAEGAARGVPVAAILTPAEVMECAHFNAV
ncbi:CoA transferase, partial [Mycolicibacterium gadium]|uniref:CoA transferase n=1 Tax=Mycolicibacterium gadium TaxID=1794 RepID=UPI0021F3B5A1